MSPAARWAGWLAVAAAVIWSAWSTEVSPGRLVEGIPFMLDFLRRMLPPDPSVLDKALRGVEEKAKARGLSATTEAREGDPADVLCDIAEQHNADLLVVGNRGMQRRVLGSVPNSVSHKAPCSVVIVKTT